MLKTEPGYDSLFHCFACLSGRPTVRLPPPINSQLGLDQETFRLQQSRRRANLPLVSILAPSALRESVGVQQYSRTNEPGFLHHYGCGWLQDSEESSLEGTILDLNYPVDQPTS